MSTISTQQISADFMFLNLHLDAQTDGAIGFPEDGLRLPIAEGRLNIAQRLAEIRTTSAVPDFPGTGRQGKCNSIAFYVAGPDTMISAAQHAVASCKVTGPPIQFHREAWHL